VRSFVAAKIHGIIVTDKSVVYQGSVTIDAALLAEADIHPYERVDVVNLSNGARWTTYALPGGEGAFTLNGGGARLGEVGDRCVVMTYRDEPIFSGARVVHIAADNRTWAVGWYEANPRADKIEVGYRKGRGSGRSGVTP
jgi:aspartate 1-decarboxylase